MNYISFDIGGTFIKYGVVDSTGLILNSGKTPTPKTNCGIEIPKIIIETTEIFKKQYKIEAVGISTAGQVNSNTGTIVFAMDTIPNYTGCKIKETVMNSIKIPTFVENDANCAALGELWKGAGKTYSNFACLTLGTGVGGAIIINSKLFAGFHENAGDFGKMLITSKILSSPAHFDYVGSTKSLIKRYSKLSGREVDGLELVEKIKSLDEEAIEAYDDFLESLIIGLQNIVYLLDTEVIVIGGGISAQGDFFFNRVDKMFKEKVIGMQNSINIIKAELENDAGLIGAAYICTNSNYKI